MLNDLRGVRTEGCESQGAGESGAHPDSPLADLGSRKRQECSGPQTQRRELVPVCWKRNEKPLSPMTPQAVPCFLLPQRFT